jgi:hypothetical protein
MPLITIAAVTIPNWQGAAANVSLRIYANDSFTAQSGAIVPQTVLTNAPSLGTFFKTVPCSIASGALTIPLLTLESTVDSPDNPDATYAAVFWDEASQQLIQPFGTESEFSLPVTTPTTWSAIFTAEISHD